MKYYWFLLFIAKLSYGQSDGNAESNKLLGTTILTASEKNMTARWVNGISLKRIIKSECQGSNEKINPDKINHFEIKNDSIVSIDITINANCCYDFLAEIEVTKDNVLNLIYHGYGSYCSCNCCFGLTYELLLWKDDKEYVFETIKSVMINNNRDTQKPVVLIKK